MAVTERFRRWYASTVNPGEIIPVVLTFSGGAARGRARINGDSLFMAHRNPRGEFSIAAGGSPADIVGWPCTSKTQARARAAEIARKAALKALERTA